MVEAHKGIQSHPEEVIERIASLKALNTQQQEDREYAAIEHEYGADGKRTGRSGGWTDAELAMEDYLWDLQNKLSPSEYQYYENIYTGRHGVPSSPGISSRKLMTSSSAIRKNSLFSFSL